MYLWGSPRSNPFPNKPWSLRVYSLSLLKTLGKKEKLLVTSNFSFSLVVFYPFREQHVSGIFNKYDRLQTLSVWKSLKFVVWRRVEVTLRLPSGIHRPFKGCVDQDQFKQNLQYDLGSTQSDDEAITLPRPSTPLILPLSLPPAPKKCLIQAFPIGLKVSIKLFRRINN